MKLSKSQITKNDKETAKVVRALFKSKLDELIISAREGNRNAPVELMKVMNAENWALRRLGVMVGDQRRLVKVKPWTPASHLYF